MTRRLLALGAGVLVGIVVERILGNVSVETEDDGLGSRDPGERLTAFATIGLIREPSAAFVSQREHVSKQIGVALDTNVNEFAAKADRGHEWASSSSLCGDSEATDAPGTAAPGAPVESYSEQIAAANREIAKLRGQIAAIKSSTVGRSKVGHTGAVAAADVSDPGGPAASDLSHAGPSRGCAEGCCDE